MSFHLVLEHFTSLDGRRSLMLTMCNLESMMYDVVVKGWVVIVS